MNPARHLVGPLHGVDSAVRKVSRTLWLAFWPTDFISPNLTISMRVGRQS